MTSVLVHFCEQAGGVEGDDASNQQGKHPARPSQQRHLIRERENRRGSDGCPNMVGCVMPIACGYMSGQDDAAAGM